MAVKRFSTLSASVPLPLFRRNTAAIGRATAELTQTLIEKQSTYRDARAQVIALWQQQENLRTRISRLTGLVLPILEHHQKTAEASYSAEKLDFTDVLLVHRQTIDALRELLEARTALRLNQVMLESSAGWPLAAAPSE